MKSLKGIIYLSLGMSYLLGIFTSFIRQLIPFFAPAPENYYKIIHCHTEEYFGGLDLGSIGYFMFWFVPVLMTNIFFIKRL